MRDRQLWLCRFHCIIHLENASRQRYRSTTRRSILSATQAFRCHLLSCFPIVARPIHANLIHVYVQSSHLPSSSFPIFVVPSLSAGVPLAIDASGSMGIVFSAIFCEADCLLSASFVPSDCLSIRLIEGPRATPASGSVGIVLSTGFNCGTGLLSIATFSFARVSEGVIFLCRSTCPRSRVGSTI